MFKCEAASGSSPLPQIQTCRCCRPLSRRRVLAGAAASVAAAVIGRVPARSEPAVATAALLQPHRIDVHHHIVPPYWIKEKRDAIVGDHAGISNSWFLRWTPQLMIEQMDRSGVAAVATSLTTPAVWFGNVEEARKLARECNEYSARLARDYPGRVAVFAAIPLPDVEGSLKEIEHAFDVLKVDGAGFLTSYDGKYPGNKSWAPVFDELNRRKAVVFFHPASPACCTNVVEGIPPAVEEFQFDSTRAITDLLFSGTFARCPDIKFIFTHGGGALPMLAGRIARRSERKSAMAELRRLYFDTASITNAPAIAGLLALVESSQVVFGSDYPILPFGPSISQLRDLKLPADVLDAVERKNALALLPRLAA